MLWPIEDHAIATGCVAAFAMTIGLRCGLVAILLEERIFLDKVSLSKITRFAQDDERSHSEGFSPKNLVRIDSSLRSE